MMFVNLPKNGGLWHTAFISHICKYEVHFRKFKKK